MSLSAPLIFPTGATKLLLHVCCAPCSGDMIRQILESSLPLSLFFYNPNIYPMAEYEKRKAEVTRYAQKKDVTAIDADYDPENWLSAVKGLEDEPERGKRCAVCFHQRLAVAARVAHEKGYDLLATSLAVSRWKNLDQVQMAARAAVAPFPSLQFWEHDWRKNGGSQNADTFAKQENFYRQNYCGCHFSLHCKNKP